MEGWQPIETAPKGEPRSFGSGPRILGAAVGDGWSQIQIVHWEYHKNPARGSWKGPHSVWTPTHWMPLPPPPSSETE